MQRLLRILIGPELYWMLLYLGVRWLAASNVPPTAVWQQCVGICRLGDSNCRGNVEFRCSWPFRWQTDGECWRDSLSGVVGVNACAISACEAIKYPELGRDSGLMALWFMAAMLGGVSGASLPELVS